MVLLNYFQQHIII